MDSFLAVSDLAILQWFNSWVFFDPRLDAALVFILEFLGSWVIFFLLVFALLPFLPRYKTLREKNWRMVGFALISALIARFGVVEVIRFFSHRPRPFVVLPSLSTLVTTIVGVGGSYADVASFPSGHAAFYFALATGVFFYYPKTGILFFVGATVISLARVAAGLHWTGDVAAGAIVGILTALLVRKAITTTLRS